MEDVKSLKIRMSVFDWLNSLLPQYPDSVFPTKVLANDFYFDNEQVVLSGQQANAISNYNKVKNRKYLR